MSEESKEPHLAFREAVQMITAKVGGTMDSYVILIRHADPDIPDKVKINLSFGGVMAGQNDMLLEAAALIIRRFSSMYGGQAALAGQVVLGKAVEKIMQRGP